MLLEQNRPGVSENGGTANLVPGKNNRPRADMGRPSIATALPRISNSNCDQTKHCAPQINHPMLNIG
ncbi:hypothetical protein [Tardiphaga sp. 619_E2_N8_5]|uniref:hypothetical protein n=1 Tax=unclassified Tardiphaga TaxID=2631404 RepID=UPI003F286A9D